MRLDKFLKVSRLIKRRTVAAEVSDQGRVFINDRLAKPATKVKEEDIITIEYYNKTLKVKIIRVPLGNVSIQESRTLYEVIEEIHHNKQNLEEQDEVDH